MHPDAQCPTTQHSNLLKCFCVLHHSRACANWSVASQLLSAYPVSPSLHGSRTPVISHACTALSNCHTVASCPTNLPPPLLYTSHQGKEEQLHMDTLPAEAVLSTASSSKGVGLLEVTCTHTSGSTPLDASDLDTHPLARVQSRAALHSMHTERCACRYWDGQWFII